MLAVHMTHSLNPLPPLDGLAAVLAAARAGSFSAAAEELGLTHGAVSRRVQSVEHWLGIPLFERHGRGVRPTPAGQRFSLQAERALAALGEAAQQWRPRRGIETVRLSVVPSFAKLWLLPRIMRLQQHDLRIQLLVEHRLSDLDGGGADIAIRYGAGDWPGLDCRLLFGETLCPVVAPDKAHLINDAQGIAAQPLIHDSDTSQWRHWLARRGLRYRPRAIDQRFEDYDMVLSACAAGMGIALARVPLAAPFLESGALVALAGTVDRNPLAHYVVTRTSEQRAPVIELVRRLQALATDHPTGG